MIPDFIIAARFDLEWEYDTVAICGNATQIIQAVQFHCNLSL